MSHIEGRSNLAKARQLRTLISVKHHRHGQSSTLVRDGNSACLGSCQAF